MGRGITVKSFRDWVENADDYRIGDFLDDGLRDLIYALEEDNYFGTEGFNKRFA